MRSRLRSREGYALPELLVAMTVMTIVLGATLAALDGFHRPARHHELVNEAQNRARIATDRLARDLRSLASPTEDQPNAIERAEGDELIFRTVDPTRPAGSQNRENVRRVRYCFNRDTRRINVQSQTWQTATPAPMPPTTACPDMANWGPNEVLVDDVDNRADGEDQPIWLYNAETAEEITSVRTQLLIDAVSGEAPVQTTLTTGVLLRNQNRPPTASFTATEVANGPIRLNASASADPDGGALTATWVLPGEPLRAGTTYDWTPAAPGQYTVTLRVRDSGGLVDEETQEVCFRWTC